MGLAGIRTFLKRHQRIGIDTSVFIYFIEENPVWADRAAEVFKWLETAPHSAVASTLTLTELLTQPYREADQRLVNRYFALLTSFPNLEWVAPDLGIADSAAAMRAGYQLRTPDALHIATAVRSGATAFLTNDVAMSRVAEIEVGILNQLM